MPRARFKLHLQQLCYAAGDHACYTCCAYCTHLPTALLPCPAPALPRQVALETAAAYQSQLVALPGLSPQGAAQLAADLEYFCNVLTTLGVAVPPSLAAWQAAAAAPPEALPPLVEAAGDAAARAAVLAVARLRGVQLGSPSPMAA